MIRIGWTADEVLAYMKKERLKARRKPAKVGEDELGMIVEWYLPAQTLTLKRTSTGLLSAYRVVKIEEVVDVKNE